MDLRLRRLLIVPVTVAIAITIGAVVTQVFGLNAHWSAMFLAAGIGFVAGEAGLLPVLLYTGTDPAIRFQSAWIGTVLHLGLSVILSAIVILMLHPGPVFVYWLLGMYWLTLVCLCIVMVRVFRSPAVEVVAKGAA